MASKFIISQKYVSEVDLVKNAINNFDENPEILGAAERNVIKIVEIGGKKHTIKSFKVPNYVNQIVYNFFRKPKAQRSYEYANKLLELAINTPFPVAYQLDTKFFLFKKSYYVSELVKCDLTYRELTTDFSIPDHEAILRAFTRFTFELHEKGIHFLDHSPGNTLIQTHNGNYKFYLVDLNRMEFKLLDFETRIKNFAKLTIHKSMIEIMSDEYAKCMGEDYNKVLSLMWQETEAFQEKYHRKRRLKKRLKFWKGV